MKISLNTIQGINKRYGCADDVAAIGVNKLVEKIGAQLGAVEEVVELGKKYENIVIVRVASCTKHPNADKLKLCKVDDGGVVKDVDRDEQGHVQVVCGAPNAHEGMLAVWVPPGVTVPATVGKEPFVLEARDIRGQVSNGMLASLRELAIGDNHDGILELAGDYAPGTDFAEAFGLKDDVVLDIENKMFTHRPDCFGFLGVARELAGIQQQPFKSPDWYTPKPVFPGVEAEELKLEVKNELPQLVPRFAAITMRDVQVGPSPVWLQVELAKVGVKSINNIVDYGNWFMLETGQPIHIYDYDKVKALSEGSAAIVIRHPNPGEKIKLLNGKEIEPRPESMMVATDKRLICIGGAMGGTETEVGENTKNIVVEAANWDMYEMRRTAMEHGIFTDAVTRFTKGQSPLQNLAVVAKLVDEIREHAGGKVASTLIDDNHLDKSVLERGSVHAPVTVTGAFVNDRLGLKLSVAEMRELLINVEFGVEIQGEQLTVTAPFWRTDIELPEDVVEEIGRLYGYENLPLELPKRDITPAQKDPLLEAKAVIRARLAKAGANEILTYSFVHGSLLDRAGQDSAKAFQVANALSPDLQYYRMSLMPSLLEKAHPNIKAGHDRFALFEIGKTHSLDHGQDDDGLPKEFEFTALVVTAADKLKQTGAAYYEAKKYLETLTSHAALEYKPVGEEMRQYPVTQPYDFNRSALVSLKDGEFLGIIGEFKPGVARALKLPKYSAGFEVDTTVLTSILSAGTGYLPLSRFPNVKQDITLKVPADLTYAEVYDFVKKELWANAPSESHVQLDPVDIYQKESNQKHITFRLTTFNYDRTLTDAEVNKLLDAVANAAKTALGAERI